MKLYALVRSEQQALVAAPMFMSDRRTQHEADEETARRESEEARTRLKGLTTEALIATRDAAVDVFGVLWFGPRTMGLYRTGCEQLKGRMDEVADKWPGYFCLACVILLDSPTTRRITPPLLESEIP